MNFANPEKIRRISVEDGSPTDVADVLGDTLFGNIAVSPDGKFLAYPYQQYSPPIVALAVIPAVGGPALKTFAVPGFLGRLRYSPDGGLWSTVTEMAPPVFEAAAAGKKANEIDSVRPTGRNFRLSVGLPIIRVSF